jgi:hypothetical protein
MDGRNSDHSLARRLGLKIANHSDTAAATVFVNADYLW